MVRACRPPAREPARSWLARRSTMTTSTPANASSPANIRPVGPPPAITTACSVMATMITCRGRVTRELVNLVADHKRDMPPRNKTLELILAAPILYAFHELEEYRTLV